MITEKIKNCATLKNAIAWQKSNEKFLFCMNVLEIFSCSPAWVDYAIEELELQFENILKS